MASIELKDVRKSFGDQQIIRGIDLTIHDREFLAFVGPSGSGKSTLLRMIAGLEELSGGELLIDGVSAAQLPAAKRGLAMVFQSYALYPHMTVAQNMDFHLRLAGVSKRERDEKVRAVARVLEMETLLDRKPRQLSGGQMQRVAIGRAMTRQPKAFLLDEPLSNLDAALQEQMRLELARLHQELQTTMVYVTHDQLEAMTMADRIVVLNHGAVEQSGTPLELYRSPATLFVAGFIGSPKMNLLAGEVADIANGRLGVRLSSGVSIALPYPARSCAVGDRLTVGVRSEHFRTHADGEFSGQIEVVEHLGSRAFLHVYMPDRTRLVLTDAGDTKARPGDALQFRLLAEHAHLFDSAGKSLNPSPGGEL